MYVSYFCLSVSLKLKQMLGQYHVYNVFYFILLHVKDAGAVIHSHSKNSVMASLLCQGREFRISHIEMIKGIKKDSAGKALFP